MLSPEFSLAGLASATLTFDHVARYFANFDQELKVQVSTDGTTWKDLVVDNKPSGKDWNFIPAKIDLSAYAGKSKVYISFLYTSTTASAPTWEIRNVVVK